MLTLIVLIVLLIAGIIINSKASELSGLEVFAQILIVISGLLLLIHIIVWPVTHFETNVDIAKIEAFEITIEESRQNVSEFERAAILQDIAEWNEKIVTYQMCNKNWFLDQYIPDSVDDLKLLK